MSHPEFPNKGKFGMTHIFTRSPFKTIVQEFKTIVQDPETYLLQLCNRKVFNQE